MRGGTNLYIIQMAVTGDFKVGRSKDASKRLSQLQVGCPHRLKLLLEAKGLGHMERRVHQALMPFRTRYGSGEWFREEGMGSIPIDIWQLVPVAVLEDPDWWRRR